MSATLVQHRKGTFSVADLFLAVDFTDGRTVQTIVWDPAGDTEETVTRLTARMAVDGWWPIKNSDPDRGKISPRMVEKAGAFKIREPRRHFLDVRGAGMFRIKRHAIPTGR